MIQSGGSAFKHRGDNHHTQFLGQPGIHGRGFPGEVCREVECVNILVLAEIQRVVQLLVDNQIRAFACGLDDFTGQAVAVVGYVGGLALLYEGHLYFVGHIGRCARGSPP